MQDLFGMIRRLAPHVRTALVTGETGTGKELVARALHRMGPRKDKRFVAVNCSAVVETLFESELFGHVRGAFTGATDNKPGLFELADGGTLFLDEIGELPMTVQAKLLRVLELGEVHRVGSLEPRRVNVHVVAATNRDLRKEVGEGRFRSDLYYRLNVVEVKLPALRDRREDISYLTAAFVRETAERLLKPIVGLTSGAERVLGMAPWDGNVRELRNVVERMVIATDREELTRDDVPTEIRDQKHAVPRSSHASPRTFEEQKVEAERQIIVAALERNDWHITHTAKELGLSDHASLLKVMRRLGVQRDT
jgi:transcriptional regulator with GAF, ATPase, and Fis domain